MASLDYIFSIILVAMEGNRLLVLAVYITGIGFAIYSVGQLQQRPGKMEPGTFPVSRIRSPRWAI